MNREMFFVLSLQAGTSVSQGNVKLSLGARREWTGRTAHGGKRQQRAQRGGQEPDRLRVPPRCHSCVDAVLGVIGFAKPCSGMPAVTLGYFPPTTYIDYCSSVCGCLT